MRARFFSFLFLCSVAAAAAQSADKSVTTTQVVAWLTGGVSSARLARLVHERGLATLPTQTELRQVEAAGAGKDLMRILRSGDVQSALIGDPIPESLLQAVTQARQQNFHQPVFFFRLNSSAHKQRT